MSVRVGRKGKILHLLKVGAKPAPYGRKRKRHEVFNPEAEEQKAEEASQNASQQQPEGQQPSEQQIGTVPKYSSKRTRLNPPDQ